MWTIRQEQMKKFETAAVRSFEQRLLAHLREVFPAQYSQLGEPGVRELIRYGMQRAAFYGIRSEKDVSRYISLMLTLGRDFDSDAHLSWASDILRNPQVTDPSEKVDLLDEAARDEAAAAEERNDG